VKLFGAIAVHVQGEEILRAPRFLDKLKRAFGGTPDLRTGRVKSSIEATAIVEGIRDALRGLGVSNAVSLVIDNTVLFHDRDGKPDDLGDLFLAFSDNQSVFGAGFDELRLAVEHREAGLHVIVETQARSEHARGAPAVRVLVSGRIEALTPKPGEDAETYRKRAEPVATDANALELYRVQFTAFVDRVRDAIAAAMPTAQAEVEVAESRVVRPDPTPPQPQQPSARYYDPYEAYYPSPLGFVAETFLWSSIFAMAMPPHVIVVDHYNHVQGFTDDPGIVEGPTMSSPDDGGSWWDNALGGDTEMTSAPDFGHEGSHAADTGGGMFDDAAGAFDDGGGGFDDGGGGFDGGFDGGGGDF
jgi:hypothetical protein